MKTTVHKLWPFGWLRVIRNGAGDYIDRFSLRAQTDKTGGGWRVYVHRFHQGDAELHNHPWKWAFSIVLKGSYTERRADWLEADRSAWYCNERRVRWFNFIRAEDFHRISELHGKEVVTLFIAGPLHGKGWGFLVPGRGYVDAFQRFKEKGL